MSFWELEKAHGLFTLNKFTNELVGNCSFFFLLFLRRTCLICPQVTEEMSSVRKMKQVANPCENVKVCVKFVFIKFGCNCF